jgi:hypothetical protein
MGCGFGRYLMIRLRMIAIICRQRGIKQKERAYKKAQAVKQH